MALTLRIMLADGPEPELALTLDAPRVVIGRGPGCEVLLPDPTVSLRHAIIEQRDGKNVITDEGSTNGIVVGMDKLPPRTPQTLGQRDIVRVGRIWLEVQAGLGQPSEPKQAKAVARRWAAKWLADSGEPANPVVRVVDGPDRGASVELGDPQREYVLGRSKETDLCLGGDARLSRRHLSVSAQGSDWVVRDLGSKRGAQLNGEALTRSLVVWPDGGRIELGETVIELWDPVADALSEVLGAPDERMSPVEFEARPPGFSAKPAPRRRADDASPEAVSSDEAVADSDDDPGAEPSDELDDARFGSDDRPQDDRDDEMDDEMSESSPGPGSHAWLETAVVLVALAVLGVSLAGLVWLLGGS